MTILDDDVAPTILVSGETIRETAGTATFTVSLSTTSGLTVTVDYTTADETATAASDYISKTGTIVIPAGQITATVRIGIHDDTIAEDDERFALTLSHPDNGTLDSATATAIIQDDEMAAVMITPDMARIPENGSASFVVTLSAEPTASVTITLSSQDTDECVPTVSFVVLDNSNWNTGASFNIDGVQDDVADGDQTCPIAVGVDSNAAQFITIEVDNFAVIITDTAIPTAVSFAAQRVTTHPASSWFWVMVLTMLTGWVVVTRDSYGSAENHPARDFS